MKFNILLIVILGISVNLALGAKGPVSQDAFDFEYATTVIGAGEQERITVRYALTTIRNFSLELKRGTTTVAQTTTQLPMGRGNKTILLQMPSNLTNANDYQWIGRLLDGTIILDYKIVPEVSANNIAQGSTLISPDHPFLLYEGRIDATNAAKPEFIWPANSVSFRFQGTSIKADIEARGSDPQWHSVAIGVLINGDSSTYRKISLTPGTRNSITLVSGLPQGNHTLTLFRDAESVFPFILHGLQLDVGKGLLQPKPRPNLKFQFYGNSVSCGGSADPTNPQNLNEGNDNGWGGSIFTNYSGVLTHNIPAQYVNTCKGGTGLTQSFVLNYVAKDYINHWHFNTWDPRSTTSDSWAPKNSIWENSKYRADVVVIEYGQNDMGNPNLKNGYKEYLGLVRQAHPNASILAVSGFMVAACGSRNEIQAAVTEFNDPKVFFHYIPCDPAIGGSHPKPRQHSAIAIGPGGLKEFLYNTVLADPIKGEIPNGGISSSTQISSSSIAFSSSSNLISSSSTTILSSSSVQTGTPLTIEAESANQLSGLVNNGTALGNSTVGSYAVFNNIDFGTGISTVAITYGVPAANAGNKLELRIGSTSGTLVASLTTQSSGDWGVYRTDIAQVTDLSGVETLYLVYAGGGSTNWVADVDKLVFEKEGPTTSLNFPRLSHQQKSDVKLYADPQQGVYLKVPGYGALNLRGQRVNIQE
jgi:hypothetical protein